MHLTDNDRVMLRRAINLARWRQMALEALPLVAYAFAGKHEQPARDLIREYGELVEWAEAQLAQDDRLRHRYKTDS